MDAGAALDLVDLEPGVQMLRHAVLERDIDAMRRVPPVAGDHRPREPTEEASVFAGDHPVSGVTELGDPHHLRVGLRVLGGIEHEVEHLLGSDPVRDGSAFASDHQWLSPLCAGTARSWR
jgi:hypothetical protein